MRNRKSQTHAMQAVARPQVRRCRVQCQFPPLSDPDDPWGFGAEQAAAKAGRAESVGAAARTSQASQPAATRSARLGRLGAAAVSAAYLAGCSVFPGRMTGGESEYRVAPVLRMDNGPVAAEAWYESGKLAMQNGMSQWALLHFEQALNAKPDWASAHNGKVVALARLGHTDEAVQFAEAALAKGMDSPELQANLLLLRARMVQASAAKTQAVADRTTPGQGATRPDPTPAAGSTAAAKPAEATALSWVRHGPNVLELTGSTGLPTTVTTTASAAPSVDAVIEKTRPNPPPQSMPRDVPSGGDAPSAPVAVAAVSPSGRVQAPEAAESQSQIALEVSNGAGRDRLARHTADALATSGIRVRRLTNHVNYGVLQTEIHYRGAAHLETARSLARMLAVPATLVETTALRSDINVKVLMGADAAGRVAAALPLVQPAATLALATPR